jgi:16S rRNA (cytidine1402-2'-O)-methyltransferase
MSTGTLHLIPTNLALPFEAGAILPEQVRQAVHGLDYFIVEHAKTARQFLKQVGTAKPLQELQMAELNEHTAARELEPLLEPLLEGRNAGLLSEAGAPAVADPGAALVKLAHQRGIRVVPHIGPSSLLLALMASGLNGQRFAFHGYLPADKQARIKAIRELEQESSRHDMTQLFIETPYRNAALFGDLVAACLPNTRMCVAINLTAPDESVISRDIEAWKRAPQPDIDRKPTVFLLLAEGKSAAR